MEILIFAFVFLLGLAVGSFCNDLIHCLPKEEFSRDSGNCTSCGQALKGLRQIPVAGWLALKGKCPGCGAKISAQYPVVELVNGLMWLVTAILYRNDILTAVLFCLLFSLLLTASVIDWREYIIPNVINLVIFLLGVVRLVTDLRSWLFYLIGMLAVSLVFLLLHIVTGGNGLGMGDVKLVGAAGLLLGWPRMILAVLIGSLAGALIHTARMKKGAGSKLAFGPYLAAGIWFSALVGEQLINAYLSLFGL